MNNIVTAQELKTKGAQVLKERMKKDKEAFITVRGEKSFVVLTIDQYEHFRECELDAALKECETDLSQGNYSIKRVKDHIKDLKHV